MSEGARGLNPGKELKEAYKEARRALVRSERALVSFEEKVGSGLRGRGDRQMQNQLSRRVRMDEEALQELAGRVHDFKF